MLKGRIGGGGGRDKIAKNGGKKMHENFEERTERGLEKSV